MKTSSCEAAVAPVSGGVRISETLPLETGSSLCDPR